MNNIAASLKAIVNHTLKGVLTKYSQNYASWYQLMSKKAKLEEFSNKLLRMITQHRCLKTEKVFTSGLLKTFLKEHTDAWQKELASQ